MKPILSTDELDDRLSEPTPAVLDALRALEGDVMVLGAGGKMGPTLARMVRRGLDSTGLGAWRVLAVSRFSSATAASELARYGVQTIAYDLTHREAVRSTASFAPIRTFKTLLKPAWVWAKPG